MKKLFYTLLMLVFFTGLVHAQHVDVTFRATAQAVQMQDTIPKFSINDAVIRYVFQQIRTISLFLLPMITMRLFS